MAELDETALLPCPFCGSEPQLESRPGDSQWLVYCQEDDCHVAAQTFPCDTKDEAIAAWNRRSHQSAETATVGVKALEWGHDHVRDMWYGNPPFIGARRYVVSGNEWYFFGEAGRKFICDSTEAAKADCQADFDSRIRASLSISSDGWREPHQFTGNGPGISGADNCQHRLSDGSLCGRWYDEPETETCRDSLPLPPPSGTGDPGK